MKKLLLILLCLPFIGFGQSKTHYYSDINIGILTCQNYVEVELESGDSTFFMYVVYKDQRYRNLDYTGNIYISTKYHKHSAIDNLVEDMTTCVKYMDDPSIAWTDSKTGLFTLLAGSPRMFITADGGEMGYLEKDDAELFLAWLSQLTYPKGKKKKKKKSNRKSPFRTY
jgi:hypothetical protein